MKPLLITGASGWLGQEFLRFLAEAAPDSPGHQLLRDFSDIRCLAGPGTVIRPDLAQRLKLQVLNGDVREASTARALCDGAAGGILIHLAGVIHPSRAGEFDAVNRQGTHHLLQAAMASGVRRMVVMSSNSPFGFNPHPGHAFDEWSLYNPYQGYGRSKMQMEQDVWAAGRTGKMETVLIRAPWFYGPGQPPRQTLFFSMIREGRFPIVGDGENRRSMAYTDNLSQGLSRAALHPRAAGQAYWIADERAYSMNEIIQTVRDLFNGEFQRPASSRSLRLPAMVSTMAGLADGVLQSLGLYHQKIHVLSEMSGTIVCDIGKARTELGYVPDVDLREGMKRSMRWCIQEGLL